MNHKKSLYRYNIIFLLAISLVLGGCGLFESSEEEVDDSEATEDAGDTGQREDKRETGETEKVNCNDIRLSGQDDRHICDDHPECLAESALIFSTDSLDSDGECIEEEGPYGFYCRFRRASDGGGDGYDPPPVYFGREVEDGSWEFMIPGLFYLFPDGIPEGYTDFRDVSVCRDIIDNEESVAVCEACHEVYEEKDEEYIGGF